VLLEGCLLGIVVTPEVRALEFVGLLEGIEGSLQEVTSGTSLTLTGGVAIEDTGHLEHLLGGGGGHNTCTTRSGDKSHAHRSTLSSDLARNSVRLCDLVAPISLSDGNKIKFGVNDSTLNGTLHFLGALPSKTDVGFIVTNYDVGLKASTLTSCGLLLYWEN